MYTELHLHTAYSFLDGASQPEDMIARAAELGYTSLAITDHDGVYGAMEFGQAARDAGIRPITGAEITLADGSHLTLLAENATGYGNICRLLTHIHHDEQILPAPVTPQLTSPELEPPSGYVHLADYAEGVILLTGCRTGQLARLVDAGQLYEAEHVLRHYTAWFGHEQVVVELQQHYVHKDTQRIAQLVRLADTCGVRYAATGNVHYHTQERHRLQDVLVAISENTTLDGSHQQRRPNAEFYLRSPQQMEALFAGYPEAIRTTELIAERCASFDITRDLAYTFPGYEPETGQSPDRYLAEICEQAFAERYAHASPEYRIKARDTIAKELRLIAMHDLAGFFLLYRELMQLATEIAIELHGPRSESRKLVPPGRGRGSSVSSVVCYLIGLSPVDPLAHDLYVGRFLNEELTSVPDIDIDFPREIRERLIERVYEVYGTDRAAMVSAFSTYRLRSAVRDVGKALGLPAADLDRIAKLSEPGSATKLAEELERMPEYASRIHTPPWSYLIEMAGQLAGFPRHITQHSGGMIVSATPLNRIVPIQPTAMDGRFMCQWDKDSCSDARFIKIDFLALGMLSLVEESLELIDTRNRGPVDLGRIDFNDPAVYRMIQAGDTVGVFQIESRAQIQMLRRTLPTSLDDIVVQVAIVRPGPIIGGAVTPYVSRREQEAVSVTYDHPSLKPILEETRGVMLYQEQVVQVAETMGGFSAGQADQLRRAMTRKRSHEAMESLRQEFVQGAMATHADVTVEQANEIYDKLSAFADYGFPKSHAAAFGLLAYQSCWLKYYYPAEFLCALLNNQPMGFYAPHVLINDAKRHGIRVLRPDINHSLAACSVESDRSVRIGLSFIKGLQEEVAERIVADRKANGPFLSLADFVRRVDLRSGVINNLIAAGACDSFGLQRREMLWQAGLFIPPKGFNDRATRQRRGQQLSLPLPTEQDHVSLPRTTFWNRMADEYNTLGLSVMHHPIGLMRNTLLQGLTSSAELAQLPDGYPVRIPGLIVCRQRPGTASGITFLLLEDEFGLVNVVVYPDLYERQRREVRSTPLVIITGRLQLGNNNVNVVAESLEPIENVALANPVPELSPTQHPPSEEADPRHIQLVRLQDQEGSVGPASRSDIRAVSPSAHNYR